MDAVPGALDSIWREGTGSELLPQMDKAILTFYRSR